jgi:hypothetical protein
VRRDPEGAVQGAAFRRGSDRLFLLGPGDDATWSGTVPAPLFDLRAIPSAGEDALLLATLSGLMVWDREETRPVGATETALAVVEQREGGAAWAVLDPSRRVSWLDRELAQAGGGTTIAGAEELVEAGTAGTGVLPAGWLGAAAGKTGGLAWIAVAATDQLVVLDGKDGAEIFRAAWPELSAIAAGDVDGDGRDDLAVAAGATVALLRVAVEPTPPSE